RGIATCHRRRADPPAGGLHRPCEGSQRLKEKHPQRTVFIALRGSQLELLGVSRESVQESSSPLRGVTTIFRRGIDAEVRLAMRRQPQLDGTPWLPRVPSCAAQGLCQRELRGGHHCLPIICSAP